MKKDKLSWVMMLLFLVCLVAFLVVQNVRKPRVLVLHSYYTDFSWVSDINKGLNRVLEQRGYKIRWHYMDTKRHPDKEFMERAGSTARAMIDSWQPNVVIAIDDNVQQYVMRHYINDPHISIVFAGVNKTMEDYGFEKATNVTGMLERLNYQAIKDILIQVLPQDKRRIIHISDSSPTSEGIHKEIEEFDWSPLVFIESVQLDTYDEWKTAIKGAEGRSDFLLLTHYHTIRRSAEAKDIVPPKEVMRWTTENSKMPGVSFWGFYVEDGGMMAVALSPFEQGEVAARMAVDIIDKGIPPNKIPVETSRLFVMYMRGSSINERMSDLKMPLVYEAFARATNNYYE